MTFYSILFDKPDNNGHGLLAEAPACFTDLNLDQVIQSITLGKQAYNLEPFFYTSLHDLDTIAYRHKVMQNLEDRTLFDAVEAFAQAMRTMRDYLDQADKLHYPQQQERWFLDAVKVYCDAAVDLLHDLAQANLFARGFVSLCDYLMTYTAGERFTSLQAETDGLLADLSSIVYCLHIKDNTIKVRKYEEEPDYSAEVEKTFEKFKQGAPRDHAVKFPAWPEMNHVEAQVLALVTQLYPDVFAHLDQYCKQNRDFLDETIRVFDREVQFYIAYLDYLTMFKQTGLRFCFPQVSNTSKEVFDSETFDLALARQLIKERLPVVCNDFHLNDPERIIVVSGPNQGGKTTFARTFGQLHHLASIGCPVPGTRARLFLFDQLFTHFEREEDITNLQGKLQDDLLRIHDILSQATPDSIVIMNEIFTSTTLDDAVILGTTIMEKIIELDLLCVFVTFIDELASLSEKTVSMVSTIVPDNPTERTFRLVRRPADGLSYALSIAEKYHLTYRCLKERIRR